MGFFDGYVERCIRKNTFFKQLNIIIDWNEIAKEIHKAYMRGHSVDGRPAYKELLLFKMLLIGIWYDLNDEAERALYDVLCRIFICQEFYVHLNAKK